MIFEKSVFIFLISYYTSVKHTIVSLPEEIKKLSFFLLDGHSLVVSQLKFYFR